MTDHNSERHSQNSSSGGSRRQFLEQVSAAGGISALGMAGLLAGCAGKSGSSNTSGTNGGPKKLKAAFSNAGLQSSWCMLGKQTAELWGELLNVDITWFDGEFDPEKQRNKIDQVAQQKFDFCCFQAIQSDILAPPVKRLKQRKIPVISIDTHLVEPEKMKETGVWSFVTADQSGMAESSVQYLAEKIGGKGKVIHIGGHSGHSGAQGRAAGYESVMSKYPEVETVGGGVRWCDWKKEKARDTFESMLTSETTPIAGAFFHSDDMALACIPAVEGTIHKNMVIVGVDGQREGLDSIKAGELDATTVNPVCRLHSLALLIGQFIVRNEEKIEDLPLQITASSPFVSTETPSMLEAMYYLADPKHCLV